MIIAQISDLHVRPEGRPAYGIVDTNAMLMETVSAINALSPRPDLVLATGDLTDFGLPEEYAALRGILGELDSPLRMIIGNHDVREAFQAAFSDLDYVPRDGFVQYVVEGGPVRIVCLDSVRSGTHDGGLCDERLDWLEARLAEATDQPTLIALHHPPVPTVTHAEIDFPGAGRFGEIVAANPQIVRIVTGHNHESAHMLWNGALLSVAPGNAHQARFDLARPEGFLIDLSPPAFQAHAWREGLGLITHVVPVGRWPGRFEVSWDRDKPEESGARLWAGDL